MRMQAPARAIDAIAVVTALAFVAAELSGLALQVALSGGFIPARVGGAALPSIEGFHWVPTVLTPLTATLVHGGWLHLLFNMVMLVFCGRQVEQVLGRGPTVVLYLAGAYAAAAAQWLAGPSAASPMIGASGAISAIIGTYALMYSRRAVKSFGPVPASVVRIAWLAVGWVVLQLLVGFAIRDENGSSIAIAAHIGGFVAGLLLTRPLLKWRFPRGTYYS